MGHYCCVALLLTNGVVRLLPERLDLFTACNGCAGIGVALGGAIARLASRDIAAGGVMGGTIGLAIGALAVILQASGIHS